MTDTDKYSIHEMTKKYANVINSWKYEAPYEIYDFGGDRDDFMQIMSGYYFAVLYERELVGFMSIGPAAQKIYEENEAIFEDESYTDIAFGMRPDLTGKGFGEAFVKACMNGARELFSTDSDTAQDGIRLCVRNDNIRAKKLYGRIGFKSIFENAEISVMIIDR